MARRKPGRLRPPPSLARVADRHALYEASVQDTPGEVAFLSRTFARLRGRPAMTLREGFCGTGRLCLTWVESDPRRRAWGVDLHAPTLRWGERHHLAGAGADAREHVRLPRVDIAVGFNFSYWCFKTRDALRAYFVAARSGLVADGLLVLDCYGGTEVPKADVDERRIELDDQTFLYRWVHDRFNPLTHELRAHIDFEFADGSELARAFSYDWRLWSLPELGELLREAGFSRVRVYWEGTDARGEGNGRYRERRQADNEGLWWVFIVAER